LAYGSINVVLLSNGSAYLHCATVLAGPSDPGIPARLRSGLAGPTAVCLQQWKHSSLRWTQVFLGCSGMDYLNSGNIARFDELKSFWGA